MPRSRFEIVGGRPDTKTLELSMAQKRDWREEDEKKEEEEEEEEERTMNLFFSAAEGGGKD